MKLKLTIYAVLAASVLFAGAMIYVVYFGDSDSVAQSAAFPAVKDPERTASGTAGKLLIAYAGDLAGNLEPCG
jgi:hypothetical protein